MRNKTIFRVKDLSVSIPVGSGSRKILDDIGFSLEYGTLTAVIGESGCGKTTLCKALLGLLGNKFQVRGNLEIVEDCGEIKKFNLGDSSKLIALRGRRIGLIFQESPAALNPVIRIGKQIGDITSDYSREAIMQLLEMVGFTEPNRIFTAYPHELSGGQAQRVALALALAPQPEILVVDEPAAALDSIARQEFFDLLQKLQNKSGLTILMVTHDLRALANSAAQLIVMAAGRIVESGASQTILKNPNNPYTKAFLEIFTNISKGRWPKEELSTDKYV